MLNSKLEKGLLVFFWFLVVALYAFVIFPTRFATEQRAKILAYIYASIVTVFAQYVYSKARDNHVRKKISSFLASNQFDDCNIYLEKCIKKNKKAIWLKYERLVLLFLKGDIVGFQTYLYEIRNANYDIEKIYSRRNMMMEQLFDYLLTERIPVFESIGLEKTSYLERLIGLLAEKEKISHPVTLEKLYDIYNSPYILLKSVAALLLYKEYNKVGERQKGLLYEDKAREYAPSQEVLLCIERHFEKS